MKRAFVVTGILLAGSFVTALGGCGSSAHQSSPQAPAADASTVMDASAPSENTNDASDASPSASDASEPTAVAHPSGLVGTWRLTAGGGTQSCQFDPPSPHPTLPPMTFTITEPEATRLWVMATPDDAAQAHYAFSLPLASDGRSASGFVEGCWNDRYCQSFALGYDAALGSGVQEEGDADGGAEAGPLLAPTPLGLVLDASQSTSQSAANECTTQWRYTLVRVDCADGACGPCTQGDSRCSSGDSMQTCGAGDTWSSSQLCSSHFCENGACAGTCGPGSLRCEGNGVETCDSHGEWGAPAACQGQACVSGACTGVCEPSAVPVCHGNQAQTCDANGQWTGGACAQPTPDCSGGACACLETACPGGCVDLTTDLANCGACGAICYGACSAGRCVQTVVADPAPVSVAIDGTSIYWTSNGTQGNDGAVRTRGVEGGPSVVTLAGPAIGDVVDPGPVVVTGGTVFFGSFEAVRTVSTTGTGPLSLETFEYPTTLAVTGGKVYATTLSSDAVAVMPVGTAAQGAPPTFATVAGAKAVTADAKNVYVAGSSVVQIPIAGGAPFTLASSAATSIAVDASRVYWTSATDVLSAPIGGTKVTTLATGQSAPRAIVVDASAVYWVSADSGGVVRKVALGGGAVTMVAPAQVPGSGNLALDATYVYWAGSGAILRAAK